MSESVILMMGVGGFLVSLCSVCVLVIGILVLRDKGGEPLGEPPGEPPGNGTPMTGGEFTITNYWVAKEGDSYLMDCGSSKPKKTESKRVHKKTVVLGSAPGGAKYTLDSKDGGSLAKVDAYTWDACYCEGTCQLGSGTYNLVSENKQTFMKTDARYGLGSKGKSLVPFVSVTADKSFPHDTTLFIKNLKGSKLPNGKTHNGCVRVDDNCGDGCGAKHLDLHVGTYAFYKAANGRYQGQSDVTKSDCEILEYGY